MSWYDPQINTHIAGLFDVIVIILLKFCAPHMILLLPFVLEIQINSQFHLKTEYSILLYSSLSKIEACFGLKNSELILMSLESVRAYFYKRIAIK